MNTMIDWSLSKEEQNKFIDVLTGELAPLRAKVGISQEELAHLIGVSRQTYCAVEGKKKRMSWNTYLSLILFFDYCQCTHHMLRSIEAFPQELVERYNNGRKFMKYDISLTDDRQAKDISDMLQALDYQGLHTLKTILLMEYGRCTNQMDQMIAIAADKNRL